MANTIIKLSEPLKTKDGGTVNEISIRPPKVKDIRAARKSGGDDADQEVRLIANLSMLHPDDIDELTLADFAKIQKTLSGFFGQSETTA